MCDRFRGIRGDGRLTVSQARTLMGARTPSTRRLYASKSGVFVKESGSYRPDYLHRIVCSEFPAAQSGEWIVTIDTEVYVAAIATFVPRREGSRSVKKTTSPMSTFVSALGPGSGLRAFSQPPFGPLTSVGLKELFLKTTVLLAFASAKRIEHLHAFSVDSDCIRFGQLTLYSFYNTAIAECVLPCSQRSPCSHLPDMQI